MTKEKLRELLKEAYRQGFNEGDTCAILDLKPFTPEEWVSKVFNDGKVGHIEIDAG